MWEEAIREESFEDGYDKWLYDMIRDGVISIDKGAAYLGISVQDLAAKMIAKGYKVPEIV